MTSNEGVPNVIPGVDAEPGIVAPVSPPRRLAAGALGPLFPRQEVRPMVDTTPITPPEQNIPPEI